MVMEVINVNYLSHKVGALSFDTDTGVGAFQYTPKFISTGIQLSPIMMPLDSRIYTFPTLGNETFKGLPGLIADSLPDDFGNAVLNAWIASKGLQTSDITPLQRLKYTGSRGMGALEYTPATKLKNLNASQTIEIESLVSVAQNILNDRNDFSVTLNNDKEDEKAMMLLLSIGMSAGGARPKAVVAFNDDFSIVRSGQANVPDNFTHYLLKFDGVSEHHKSKQTFGDPMGYGAMEYVYHLMAMACDIDMMPCKLLKEGERRHFITQRFDRIGNNKVHVQTLNGIAHVDYKMTGSFSYAELLGVARKLNLTSQEAEQLFKRMVFNIISRNHDDHAKNFSFILKDGQWGLSPAYDLAYSYKKGSEWVNSHWMSLNGKRDNFVRSDFYSIKDISPIFTKKKMDAIIDKTIVEVSKWRDIASNNGVPDSLIDTIESNHRLNI